MATNYDAVASSYNRRYEIQEYSGIRSILMRAVRPARGVSVLEVGCGTGKWLAELAAAGCDVAGIDASRAMLAKAADEVAGDLRHGMAERLPWDDRSFDAVIFVNALHHFAAPALAIGEASRVLRPGGKLLSFGLDPHEAADRWYLYDFFPQILPYDLARYPSATIRAQRMREAGLADVSVAIAEHLNSSMPFAEAERLGVLERTFTSQFDVLSDLEYAAGLQRIRAAADHDPSFHLVADLAIYATEAVKPV